MQELTYKDSGVDVDKGNDFISKIAPITKKTHQDGVITGIGAFGSLFELPKTYPGGYVNPVLVSGTDGVGTKLKLTIDYDKYDTIGIDLVAMCVNDVVVMGAKPLFFLDYYAMGELNTDIAVDVVSGIAEGCIQANCALVGGETAEMNDLYEGKNYDLSGYCVGIVNKYDIIDGSKVKDLDVILGIESSGFHSNGYSLVRKVLKGLDVGDEMVYNALKPTKIYVNSILELIKEVDVHAIAHITGGGLIDNIPRTMPDYTEANLHLGPMPELFKWIQDEGNVSDMEMYRTFNCGIGMTVTVSKDDFQVAVNMLRNLGETVTVIGYVAKSSIKKPRVNIL